MPNSKYKPKEFRWTNSETLLLVGCLHPSLQPFVNASHQFGKITDLIGGVHGFKDIDYVLKTNIRNLFLGHCTQNYALFEQNDALSTQHLFVGKEICLS